MVSVTILGSKKKRANERCTDVLLFWPVSSDHQLVDYVVSCF